MDINTAIAEVLKQALIADGLARGIRECAKVWESATSREQAHTVK